MNVRRIRIGRGDLVLIRDGSGAVVSIDRGVAWVTQERDRRDVLLEVGDAFRLDRAGVAVVSAAVPAELTVSPAAGASLPMIETSARAARAYAGAGRPAYEF